jgi:hypothetical protein
MQTSNQLPQEARKKEILACAAALRSQPEGIRCEHVKELMRNAVACGIGIESEIFQAAYGDPGGREYWESHLSEQLTTEDLADLLSAHLVGRDMEESQSAIIAAFDYRKKSEMVLIVLLTRDTALLFESLQMRLKL